MINESSIPDFLKPRPANRRVISDMATLLDEYEKQFNDSISTECLYFSDEEWCTILKECLSKKKSFSEVTGIYFDYEEDEDE